MVPRRSDLVTRYTLEGEWVRERERETAYRNGHISIYVFQSIVDGFPQAYNRRCSRCMLVGRWIVKTSALKRWTGASKTRGQVFQFTLQLERTRAVSLSVWQFHTFIMVSVQLPPLLSSFHSELLLIMRQRAPLNPVKRPCKWNRSISIGCGEKYTWFTESKNVLAMVYRNAPLITARGEEAEPRQTRDTIR